MWLYCYNNFKERENPSLLRILVIIYTSDKGLQLNCLYLFVVENIYELIVCEDRFKI
jgi:hypothetical protein